MNNKMKVLLIYPGLVEGFGSYNRGSDWFNHGIGIISSLLKRDGHNVGYLDCRKHSGWKDVEAEILAFDFDIALISVATADFEAAQRIASIIKFKDNRLKIMVGGPHPTLELDETVRVDDFDYIFTHEAEITLPGLLDRIPDIPRVTKGEMPLDLCALPFVDRSLAPNGETSWFKGLSTPYFSITASRGCVYRCTFCQPAERAVFGDKVRKRSVDNVLDELEFLARDYGMSSFMIHDDCFTQYYEWVEEFCRKKQDRGLTQQFACQSRADIICKRPDLMEKLIEAGLRWVLIGFESGSDRILQFIEKGTTVEQNIQAGQICKKLGVKIFGNYMLGLPTETEEEMRSTVRMMRLIDPEVYSPSVFTPTPGSDLYAYCQEHNLNLITSAAAYSRSVQSGKKIKGVDYGLVNKLIFESMHGVFKGKIMMLRAVIRERFKITARFRNFREAWLKHRNYQRVDRDNL